MEKPVELSLKVPRICRRDHGEYTEVSLSTSYRGGTPTEKGRGGEGSLKTPWKSTHVEDLGVSRQGPLTVKTP